MRPMFPPRSDWRPPAPADLPSWTGAKRIAIDIETCDPDLRKLGPGVRRDGYIIGVSFAIEDGPAHYLPIRHLEDNMDETIVRRYLQQQFLTFTGDVVGANLSYDLDYLWSWGIDMPVVGRYRDVQIAEPLLDEHQDRYGLDPIAERYNLSGKDERLLEEYAESAGLHRKTEMWKMPARYVGAYAIEDVRLPLRLIRLQERKIETEELEGIYDLESRLLPVLVRMRQHGVRLDLNRMDELRHWAGKQELEALNEIASQTGQVITEVWNTEQCATVMRELGLSIPQTEDGKDSIRKEFLEELDHPVGDLLRRARKMNKLRGTFLDLFETHRVGDRIHGTLNQLKKTREDGASAGTISGRLSGENPNLQFLPARDPEIGPLLRSILLPDEGKQWCSADYSQQEPRLTVHYAELQKLPKAAEAASRYRDDPDTDNHTMMAEMIHGRAPTKQERSHAKNIFLGLVYSMGGAKLCRSVGLGTGWWVPGTRDYFTNEAAARQAHPSVRPVEVAGPEGKELLKTFNHRLPFLKLLSKAVERRAKQRGYIRTILGRRCRFPRLPTGEYDWTHKALNRLIQGSAADQTKLALVSAYDAGYRVQLQVHDELCMSVKDQAEAEGLAEIMRECLPLQIPSKVDIELGSSWGDSMKED